MDMVIYITVGVIAYPYVIYPLMSFLISLFSTRQQFAAYYPSITVVIAAYNEIDCIQQKLDNTYSLHLPPGLLQVIVITDGSTDGTDTVVSRDGRAMLLHAIDRKGKAAAINSAIAKSKHDIVIFTDANTMLNKDAFTELVKNFQDPMIGAVAGEKRVMTRANTGSTAAEGFYWKYESKLREWDSKAHAVTGAVGELYAIRRELLQPIPADTICEDLLITMRVISEEGKRVVYEPHAFGSEWVSETINDEWKRKVRIAAGSIQYFQQLKLMQFFRAHTFAAFQLISRKLFRWLVVPYALLVLLGAAFFAIFQTNSTWVTGICISQFVFYGWALLGYFFVEHKGLPAFFFFPFYFLMANMAIIAGTWQYLNGKSFVLWDRAKRG